ncbi:MULTISPECIES: hypothetical protein [unclassified Streptomyces]|uniref:hypothetical protein n=1 Tax=unclassified Streptomyces TaxID=2593676 RepID=UPI002E32FFE7|nr:MULTISPECIES: hypothetical protein [unclassified Streptomyces]
MLPAFAGLGLAAAVSAAALTWQYRVYGPGGLVLAFVLLAGIAVVVLRFSRATTRRRAGIYTPAELARLDDQGLAEAVERMLNRDGWNVIPMPRQGRPRLYARDRGGRRLDVGFRPTEESASDGDASTDPVPTVRETGLAGIDRLFRVLVSVGEFSHADVLWASRHDSVHLVDGRQLRRWASGASLDDLGLPD